MPIVIFVEHNGTEHRVEGDAGKSLMHVATQHRVPGILADCGGSATCGTCHGFVKPEWHARLPPPGEPETIVLDGLLNTCSTSRLTCQIVLTAELDGIMITLPARQL